MTTLSFEMTEEKALELIKDSLKLSILKDCLNAKKEDGYMNVEDIKAIINAE